MAKTLIIDYTKCTGCRLCELVCSVKKTRVSNPARARLHIVKWADKGLDIPMLCQQCEPAPCQAVCPTRAIYRDEPLQRVLINYDTCIGCKMCITTCPFGAMNLEPVTHQVVKCDLCDGAPVCVRFCPTGAIEYLETTQAALRKRRTAVEKFSELVKKFVGV